MQKAKSPENLLDDLLLAAVKRIVSPVHCLQAGKIRTGLWSVAASYYINFLQVPASS
jgi:hypothetical protein